MARPNNNIGVLGDLNLGPAGSILSNFDWVGGPMGIAYFTGQIVTHNGMLFRAVRNNDNVEPGTSEEDWIQVSGTSAVETVHCATPGEIAMITDLNENDIWIDSTDGRVSLYVNTEGNPMNTAVLQWMQIGGQPVFQTVTLNAGTFSTPIAVDLDFGEDEDATATPPIPPYAINPNIITLDLGSY